jgi:hypothetical protein
MKSVTLAVFLIGAAISAAAQSPTGSIQGVIVDQSEAALSGVTVTLVQPATGVQRIVRTEGTGLFRAPLLPVGAYELHAALDGFASLAQANISVGVGETISLRLHMTIAAVVETVTVESAAPVLETTRSKVSSGVDAFAIHHLPINGRNFVDFVLLTPGVTRDTNTGELSFAGQRSMFNSLIVDGADNNNTFFGQSFGRVGSGRVPYQFSEDGVQEFQVNSNSYAAEYGRAGAGVINVVTKSGTNQLAGSLFEFYRDKALNATNPILVLNGQPKAPYHYHQFGGTTGGPLRANHDFFFFSYDGQRNTQTNSTFLNLPAVYPNDPQTLAGIARLEPLAAPWSRGLDQDVFLGRSDHRAGNGTVTVRYNHENFEGKNYESFGNQVALEHTGASVVHTRGLNGSWVDAFTSSLFNEVKAQYARDDETGDANSASPEAAIQQTGIPVLTIGRNNFSPRATLLERVQASDSLTWIRGSHQMKIGADVQRDHIVNSFPQYFSGSYVFRSLASFAGGRPNQPNESYLQNFPGPGTSGADSSSTLSEFSAFAQDEWRPWRDLTISLGGRYDLMTVRTPTVRNPDPQLAAAGIDTSHLEPDVNNVGPRLGVAWNPGGRRYVLRGGWGLFFARTPVLRTSAAVFNNGINVIQVSFTGDAVPTYPQIFSTIPVTGGAPAKPNVFYADKDFANPRVTQGSAAIEWEWRPGTTITVTYLSVAGASLPRSVDKNIGTLSSRTFTIAGTNETVSYPFFGPDRPFSNFVRVIALESTAESRYNGVTVELNRRFSGGLQFRAAYTLGKVVDTKPDASTSDQLGFPSNPIDYEVDRSVGDNDQRHRLVASGVYLVGKWSFSAIFNAESGKPYSTRVGTFDLNGDGNVNNDRAPGTARNSLRLPAILTVDARAGRTFPLTSRIRMEVFAEAFNLFNRDNINGVVPGMYNPVGTTLVPNVNFQKPSNSAGERIVQLAMRLMF